MGLWSAMIDKIAGFLAYFPPSPPTYSLSNGANGTLRISGVAGHGALGLANRGGPRVLQLDTPRRRGGGGGETIVALHVAHPRATKTLLHSHGNAVDLGVMQAVYMRLSEALGVSVVGYDYSGYGWSTGKPSTRNTFADIRAVFTYIVEELKEDPKNIVLYGQSVGSGPTCEFASKLETLGGVILHSPLASGMRVLKPSMKKWPVWLDIYPNFEFVPRITAPILVMHGTEDEVIDISNAALLHSLCESSPVDPLWATGYNHQNLDFSPEYLPKLADFFQALDHPQR